MYVNIFIGLCIGKYYLKKRRIVENCEKFICCIYYFLYCILREMFILVFLSY